MGFLFYINRENVALSVKVSKVAHSRMAQGREMLLLLLYTASPQQLMPGSDADENGDSFNSLLLLGWLPLIQQVDSRV